MPHHYRLDFSYIGTNYKGWQIQPNGPTVQQILEEKLATFLGRPVKVIGASRTDSGVHANHQVAVFQNDSTLDPNRVMKSLNALLPSDIGVFSMSEVEKEFHPIKDARAKVYKYSIRAGAVKDPFLASFVWRTGPLDEQLLTNALSCFVGEKDYAAFAAKDGSAKTTIRTIFGIEVFRDTELAIGGDRDSTNHGKNCSIDIYIHGNGFLKQMVRNIVGTCVDIAQGRATILALDGIFASRNRETAGQTAPAAGLTLKKIFYGKIGSISDVLPYARFERLDPAGPSNY